MRIPLPKAKRYRVLLSLLSIALILVAIDLVWVRIDRRITIGYDTTRITSPLRPDGTPDYLRALNEDASAGVTDENNAARLLVPLFDPKTFLTNRICDGVYAALHLPSPEAWTANANTFMSYEDYLKSIHVDDYSGNIVYHELLETCCNTPWSRSDHPHVVEWLDRNKLPLETLALALKKPRFHVPYVAAFDNQTLLSMTLPSLSHCRYLTLASEARAMLRFHEADFAGALADLAAARRLTLLLSQGTTMIEYFNVTNMDIEVSQAMRAAAPQLTAQECRALLAVASGFPEIGPCAHQIDVERYATLDALAFSANAGIRAHRMINFDDPQEDFSTQLIRKAADPFIPSNFNEAMRRTNRSYDQWTLASLAPTYAQRRDEGDRLETEFNRQWQQLKGSLFMDRAVRITYQMFPSLTGLFRLECNTRTQRSLTRIAVALAGYHAEHNEYPATLDALTPAWLPALPTDPFTDLPFHYTRTPTGYRLYSVGPNGIDDDGRTHDQRDATHPKPDDITVTIPPMLPVH